MPASPHDLALLKHAHHVGERECGRRAAERLLATELSDEEETFARYHRTFYSPTLAELGPVEYRRIDIYPAYPGWSLFNPTVLNHGGKLVGLVRSSNYRMEGNSYLIPPSDSNRIRTRQIYIEFGDDLQVASSTLLDDPEYPRTEFSVEGLEDCRLYARGQDLWVSGTIRNFAPLDGRCRIATARLDLQQHALADCAVLEPPGAQHEKNWMPIVGQECWLYACNTGGYTKLAVQAEDRWALLPTAPAPRLARLFRGGGQVVPYGDGYLAVIHEVTLLENTRSYEHRLVWFDEHLRLRKLSQPFYFRNARQVEFAAGLAVLGEQVVLSYGHNDRAAWLAVLPRTHVDGLLEPLP